MTEPEEQEKPVEPTVPEEFLTEEAKEAKQAPEVRTSTKQKRAKWLEVFAATGNISQASKEAGISRQCYYEWLKVKEFAAAVADAREACIHNADSELLRRGLDPSEGDTRALVAWLRAHAPALYGDKTKVQIVGDDEIVRQVAEMIANNVTDPELYRRLLEELHSIAAS